MNLYAYVGNDPMNMMDPSGQSMLRAAVGLGKTGAQFGAIYAAASYAVYKIYGPNLKDAGGAYYHYLFGKGSPAYYSFHNIDTSSVRPSQFAAVQNYVSSGSAGTYAISNATRGFSSPMTGGWAVAGRVLLSLSGTLSINKDGTWSFTGNLSAVSEPYDFNEGKPGERTALAEFATTVGREVGEEFGAEAYMINYTGSRSISESGNAGKQQSGPFEIDGSRITGSRGCGSRLQETGC